MKRKGMKSEKQLLTAVAVAALVLAPVQGADAANNVKADYPLVINEINSAPDDWVEFMNVGTADLDVSGYEIRDNSNDHRFKIAEGTVVKPGELLLVKADTMGQIYDEEKKIYVDGQFDAPIGIGSGDSIRLYDKEGELLDEYSWTEHASYEGNESAASFGRFPDGTGEFINMPETPGAANRKHVVNVVINEVQSNDPDGKADWIELANPSDEELDISGIVIKDDDDTHAYTIPEGTKIPAKGFKVFTKDDFGFGLGKNDQVRLYRDGELIASTTWPEHTNPTWGLYPDVTGTEYRNTKEATPGAANTYDESTTPEEDKVTTIDWPGSSEVTIYDTEKTFLEDSSGLDFHNGQLYAVDNGTGKFWILDVAKDGSLSFAKGFEDGKRVRFQKDADNATAKGPDTEGITVDGSGMVYVASERDNANKGVNFNSILTVNPQTEGADLVAEKEWDLTDSLPQVSANTGIEAVEWVAGSEVSGKLFDQNTQAGFDMSNYPDAVADGVFFVALEDNGHVYAYVLNKDGSSVQIADIDSKLGGAMALDYDTYSHVLWVAADDGFGNKAANITFNGTGTPDVVHVKPAAGVDVTANNEGFAIAEASYTVNGNRPVYHFLDGVETGALSIGSIHCDYQGSTGGNGTTDKPGTGGSGTTDKPGTQDNKAPAATPEKDTDAKTKAPKTGDNAYNMMLLLLGVAASGTAIAGNVWYRKKRPDEL